jgi:hypothetical protein
MILTRWRWIFPLRRWYGIMMAFSTIGDAAIAAVTTDFAGGLFGRLAGHSFLLVGLLMTMQRALGQQRTVRLAVAPLILLLCFAFAFIVHEELFKGADMFRLHPSVA